MTSSARSLSRTVRAALFAAVCVVLAAVGHAAMSGHHVAPRTLLAAFAVTGAAAWCAGRHRRGPVAIGGGLVAVQTVLHLLFGTLHTQPAPVSAARPHGAHDPAALAATPGMLTAHLLAALCCALWLWRGEAVFFRLLGALRALALPPLALHPRPAPLPSPPAPYVRARGAVPGPRTVPLAYALLRRGPPLSLPLSA